MKEGCLPRVKSVRETIQGAGSYAEAAVYYIKKGIRDLSIASNLQDPVIIMASILRRSSPEGTCPRMQSYLLN